MKPWKWTKVDGHPLVGTRCPGCGEAVIQVRGRGERRPLMLVHSVDEDGDPVRYCAVSRKEIG